MQSAQRCVCNELPLDKKVDLIKFLEDGNTDRQAVEEFKVSKGTVSNIKDRKNEYFKLYEEGEVTEGRCRKRTKADCSCKKNFILNFIKFILKVFMIFQK